MNAWPYQCQHDGQKFVVTAFAGLLEYVQGFGPTKADALADARFKARFLHAKELLKEQQTETP